MPTLEIIEDESLWVPNPGGQQGFMDDYTHRYVAFAAGWGTGKTWAGARKSIDLHVLNAFDDNGQPTFSKGLVIEPTYSLARAIAIPEIRTALDEAGIAHRFVADPQRFCFELPDLGTRGKPSEILVRSAEKPELITGFQVGWVWGDEAARWYSNAADPSLDALLQADGRLRDPKAACLQMNLTFTHEGDATPIYLRFEQEKRENHAIYHGRTEENPAMRAFAEEQRKQLTAELATQYLDGGAASFRGGRVYGDFDPDVNVDDSLGWDFNRPLQLAIDFNVNPGCHVELGQHFPDRDLATTVHEIYADRMDVKRFVPVFGRWLATFGDRYPFPGKLELFGDASGGNSNAATGESCWEVMAAGLRSLNVPYTLANVPSANPHVADRVNAVNCAFRNMAGKVRYRVHPRCVKLIADFKSLKWSGNELDKRDRQLSHGSDADGYRIYQIAPIRRVDLAGNRVAYASA